jgi:hypothetical protein
MALMENQEIRERLEILDYRDSPGVPDQLG